MANFDAWWREGVVASTCATQCSTEKLHYWVSLSNIYLSIDSLPKGAHSSSCPPHLRRILWASQLKKSGSLNLSLGVKITVLLAWRSSSRRSLLRRTRRVWLRLLGICFLFKTAVCYLLVVMMEDRRWLIGITDGPPDSTWDVEDFDWKVIWCSKVMLQDSDDIMGGSGLAITPG